MKVPAEWAKNEPSLPKSAPELGEMDQVTAVFDAPVTEAENFSPRSTKVSDAEPVMETIGGGWKLCYPCRLRHTRGA